MKLKAAILSTCILAASLVSTSAQAYTLISQGLSSNSYSASSIYTFNTVASKAFDGNTNTIWNAGTYAPAWIEVNLGNVYDIARISLYTEQSPAGGTTDQIWVSNSQIGSNRSNATLLTTFQGMTSDNQLLDYINTAHTQAQYVQIFTTLSPSWIAWEEVQVFTNDSAPVPEPSSMALLGLGLAGLGYYGKRRKNSKA